MGSNQSISGPPCKWFFQITFFGAKYCQKILKFHPNICAKVRPGLKILVSGLPGSVIICLLWFSSCLTLESVLICHALDH